MAEKMRILYIDDNPGDRALVKDSLEKQHGGFSLMLAKSKEEFEKLIHEHIFDLVLTDFNILGFKGLQVIEIVNDISPDTPVIVVTGTGSEEIAVAALKKGASDYIIKSPQHIVRLPSAIKAVVERKRAESEQKKGAKELLRMNRVYSLISQINQLIVRTHDRDRLFQHSCDIAIEYGKFQMAWIGLVDEAAGCIKPACWSGNENGYLSNITINISSKEPEGRGPTGTAFREERYFVCNDIEHDPIMIPWREEALKRGYRSSIGIPITLDNKVIGVFTLYAPEPKFFDHQEIAALREATNDISYALDTIKAEEIRQNAERELVKMNRVFALISQINQLIVRTKDQDKLFQEACNIAINFGQFRMAWVGLLEDNSTSYKPYCWAGHEDGYFSAVEIKSTDDTPEGRGPSGRALREGKYFICNDIKHDPVFEPWRKEALKRNYNSSITLPIKQEGNVIGTFNIYSEETAFFDVQEIKLLEEVVDDISFALDAMKAEEIRRQAENDLRERQEELQAYFEHDISADFMVTADGKLISCNKTFYKVFGIKSISQEENFNITDFYKHPEQRKELLKKVKKFGKVENYEIDLARQDGKPLYVLGNILGNFGEYGELVSLREYVLDITKRKTAELSLKKLSRAVEQSPETIVITDKEGKIEYVNPTFLEVTGYTSEEVIGKNPSILSTHEKSQEEYKEMWDTILSGQIWRGEFHDKKKNGELYWEQASISPITNEKGEITHFVAVKENITERKKVEETLIKLSRAVEQSPESIVITDRDGNIEYVNPTFTNVTGYSREEVIGENPRFLSTHRKSKKEYKELWNTILSGEIWHGEFHNKKKNGEMFWEQASISPIMNEKGEITHFVEVKEDITEKKVKEVELKMALEKAQESDRLKSAFLANMSHEIRTPMNGIIGFSELLKEPKLGGKQQREYLDIIEKSADRMLNIITDIVNISKIEAGQTDLLVTEVNINKEMDFLFSFFKPETDHKNIKLSYYKDLTEDETIVETDREKISSILANIIKNALTFTSEGSIDFGYRRKGDMLEFFVKDTGHGIPDEYREVVFERFRQGSDSLTRHHEGSGLGLSISKAYVEMLGGKIWFESSCDGKDHGTEFYFTLPYHPITEATLQDKKEKQNKLEEKGGRKLKILIVEDDDISEMLLKYVLAPIAKNLLVATSGVKAIEICKQNPDVDIIMMDIRIPGMNGYQTTREIRKFNKDVVIIAQTAFAMEEDREKALTAGCNDYISKPIQLDKFKTILQQFNLDK
jgi:hypothetical protein